MDEGEKVVGAVAHGDHARLLAISPVLLGSDTDPRYTLSGSYTRQRIYT